MQAFMMATRCIRKTRKLSHYTRERYSMKTFNFNGKQFVDMMKNVIFNVAWNILQRHLDIRLTPSFPKIFTDNERSSSTIELDRCALGT
jgi:hypothetical protein